MIKHNVKCHPLILVAVKLNCLLISLIKVKERDKKTPLDTECGQLFPVTVKRKKNSIILSNQNLRMKQKCKQGHDICKFQNPRFDKGDNKNIDYDFWYDPAGARTRDLPHKRRTH